MPVWRATASQNHQSRDDFQRSVTVIGNAGAFTKRHDKKTLRHNARPSKQVGFVIFSNRVARNLFAVQ